MPKKKTAPKDGGRPTIIDVAELSGFSRGTISRAFNGQAGISTATREKVLKAAREIGYYPNPSARDFKRGYTKRIGMILPNLANANYSELYEQLDLVTEKAGHSSILALTHNSAEREKNLLHEMSAGGVDALVVNSAMNFQNLDVYLRLKAWRFPLLFLYLGYEDEFDALGVDQASSLKIAMAYLRDVGHRKVAYVGSTFMDHKKKPVGKCSVLINVLHELGMEFDAELSVHSVSGEVSGEEAFQKWGEIGRRPTAVVTNDRSAISLQVEAARLGVSIPGEMSLLGSDDISTAEPLGLSTLRVDRAVMAQTIFHMLQNRIHNFDSPIHKKAIRSEFVLRSSMGPVRKGPRA